LPAENEAITRDEKAKNLVLNYSMIMMGLFEDVFAGLASKMSEAMVAGAAAISESLAPGAPTNKAEPEGGEGQGPQAKVEAEVSNGVKKMFSEMRREAAAEMSAGGDSFKEFLRDPRLDKGISIVEAYEFGLPKLTEPLRDEDIAAYLTLLGKEDARMVKMFRELSEWQKSMPELGKDRH
jgi:hypothetical protein